ncbi:flagellar protein [Oceanobacillus piezotolerans]|uniref:Flagellar protein n=1 Tax=Oceanobacillus piezotolerans TaxID=2448030 RepID=A0A498D9L7_9BACI|nr:TIGR02530 family flagellar biosynthesis protein [Oceanobacillus piezotolerans]RLL45321.1 flagellar protein [Oceanobacillus piezotolerans]
MDHRIHQISSQHALHIPSLNTKTQMEKSSSSFKDILNEQVSLKISKHASERLNERSIEINDKQWKLINEKMQEAKRKGVTDSLVLTNNAALVVSTKNNTVVTAMNKEEATSRIFTNINGTILISE